MKKVCLLLLLWMLFTGCDAGCKKDHVFQFSYPNETNQREFIYEIDYSEVPKDEECVHPTAEIIVANCDGKNILLVELYSKGPPGSEFSEYFLDETLAVSPGESGRLFNNLIGGNKCNQDRYVSVMIKGSNSNCFKGEINIKTSFLIPTLGKARCPYGYEIG